MLLWTKDYIGTGAHKSQDRVTNYPFHLTERDGTSVTHRDTRWLNHFMPQKRVSPGLLEMAGSGPGRQHALRGQV